MKNTSKVKLRAFIITLKDMNKTSLLDDLSTKLDNTNNSLDRMMPMNPSSSDEEFDLCCNYDKSNEFGAEHLFGTMLRIKRSNEVGNISDDLLSKKKFSVQDFINGNDHKSSYVNVNRFYFLIQYEYLICNLSGNRNIKSSFETYVNWLLNTQFYIFTPKLILPKEIKLTDLKEISLNSGIERSSEKGVYHDEKLKLISLGNKLLSLILSDHAELKDIEENDIITAKLILRIKKPRGMSKEDFQKEYGTFLKNINDSDAITFTDKKGRKFNGSKIERTKTTDISITDDGSLDEKQMRLDMLRFIDEIKNDDTD